MFKKKLVTAFITLSSFSFLSSANANGNSSMPHQQTSLLLEAGFAYNQIINSTNFIYNDFNDSRTKFPSSFFGGYIGASVFFPTYWLLNSRFYMYGEREVHPYYKYAPRQIDFTVDKIWGDFAGLSGGVGVGATIEYFNPIVEGFAMYQFYENLRAKLNVVYRIPLHDNSSSGAFIISVGLNYSFPLSNKS